MQGGQAESRVSPYFLTRRHGRLSLVKNGPRPPSPTCVDFLDKRLLYRLRTISLSADIARAAGIRKIGAPRVLDATAGLGRDAFILAALGCRVTLLERSPIVHALLEDGLLRAGKDGGLEVSGIIERMSLFQVEALEWFDKIQRNEVEKPDVIYLDPMFPSGGKSAGVKKDISALRAILGGGEEPGELLVRAMQCAGRRVVLKRQASGDSGGLPRPGFSVVGKTCRFDVYPG